MRALLVELRAIVDDLRADWREFVSPTWAHDDSPDLEVDAAVRTEWVRNHRHPDGG